MSLIKRDLSTKLPLIIYSSKFYDPIGKEKGFTNLKLEFN